MKNISICLLIVSLSINVWPIQAQQVNSSLSKAETGQVASAQLSPQERAYAIDFLKESTSGLTKAIQGLNDTQISFKPASDKWNIEECVKHIAAAESTLWTMVETSLKQAANPEKRSEIRFTDQDLIKAVQDRSQKSTTFAALEPVNSPYKTLPEALAAFKTNRDKLIAFVASTKMDLRNHVSVLPIGTYDAYQFILLISAHTNRHTQQIEEIKAGSAFPKK